MPRVVLIDNYDSFTWNLYEYLCREAAEVLVHRNDKITIPEIEDLKPDLIMISPGPGHPDTDSGISCDVIRHFMGKLPVFGVCMGLQCIVACLGGKIKYAGEIVHGKTSAITHNNKGVFKGVTQGVAATRYHSLAAHIESLPEDLEVTATSDSGVIQGVRHKRFTLEGVQFHPESIMSEEGRTMLRNFLAYRGGLWSDMPIASSLQSFSILDKIYARRRRDVEALKALPGRSLVDLERSLELGLGPKLIDFRERLLATPNIAVLAEIKRASPSKGDINLTVHAPTQALTYAKAGAAAISILTEPHWFKGSIEDLALARRAVDSMDNRPAILRKEFVFCKYQIAEARLYGGDTVLLIVKMLTDTELVDLLAYSRKLGMEPLVEVSSAPELERALSIGSKIIGVNNRDLHTFSVDMELTSTLAEAAAQNDIILAALSGINGPEQVLKYKKEGVSAVLVGEALMRAENPAAFVRKLAEV